MKPIDRAALESELANLEDQWLTNSQREAEIESELKLAETRYNQTVAALNSEKVLLPKRDAHIREKIQEVKDKLSE